MKFKLDSSENGSWKVTIIKDNFFLAHVWKDDFGKYTVYQFNTIIHADELKELVSLIDELNNKTN